MRSRVGAPCDPGSTWYLLGTISSPTAKCTRLLHDTFIEEAVEGLRGGMTVSLLSKIRIQALQFLVLSTLLASSYPRTWA